jgi:DHA2 family multidrug resistance protein-like MFS transporter
MEQRRIPPVAGRREWIGLAVLALACLVYAMDVTVLNLAAPRLSADLQPTGAQLLWILDIYGFVVAGALMTMGTLGDRIGRRRLLMIGAAAFAAASVLAAFSTSAEMLIVTRALLGIAGATLAPGTLSLIRNMFLDPRQRTTAIGVWIASFSAGGALGPLLGGVLLERFWWGSVFLLAVPVMLLLLALGPVVLPEFRDPDAGRLDLPSAVLSLVAVLTAIYGLKQTAEHGPGWTAAGFVLGGIVVGWVFVRRQQALPDPLLDLGLFRNPVFTSSLVAYMLAAFVAFASFVFVAQYLQLVVGLSPLAAGLWTLPSAGGMIVGSTVTPRIVRRVRPAVVMGGGLALAAAGFGMLTRVDGGSELVLLATATLLISLGLSPVFTLATDLVVGGVPPERAGTASAISETAAEFGGALGIAVLGSIAAAVYRRGISGGLPSGLPAEAAASAGGTLGGVVAATGLLPAKTAAELMVTARSAFAQGVHLTAGISAVLAIGGVVLVALLLRDAGRADPDADPNPCLDGARDPGADAVAPLPSAGAASPCLLTGAGRSD